MARQKMMAISRISEIIDLMKEKKVFFLEIPDTVKIQLDPSAFLNYPSLQGVELYPDITNESISDEDRKKQEMDLLLHSSKY